jgi:hypothetical protein
LGGFLGIEDDDGCCFMWGDIVLEVASFHEFSFSFFFFFFSLFLFFFIELYYYYYYYYYYFEFFLVIFIGQLLQGTLIFNPLNLSHMAASPCVFLKIKNL